MEFIRNIFALLGVVLVLLFIFASFVVDGGKYTIRFPGAGKQYTDSYIKNNDCIIFTNSFGKDMEACGHYSIIEN